MNQNKTLLKIIERIEAIKNAVEEQTGSYKYSDQYDDCLNIIKEYLDEPR